MDRFDNLEIGVGGALTTGLKNEFHEAAIQHQRNQVAGGLYAPIIARINSIVQLLRVAGINERLPNAYRLYCHQETDAKGKVTREVWFLEKKADPYEEGKAWWTLNPEAGGPNPPRALLQQFATDLEQGWLASVLDDQAKWQADATALVGRIDAELDRLR